MAHTLPPRQQTGNIPAWPDAISAVTTDVRKVHLDDAVGNQQGLRDYANKEAARRGIAAPSFTDQPLAIGTTKIRAVHITDLRTALDNLRTGNGAAWPCQIDSFGGTGAWTDAITPGSTQIRAVHITEMRTKMQYLMTACICESDQCQYCADCGYAFQYRNYCSCECDDHQNCGCNNQPYYWYYAPGSIGLAPGTTNPYKSVSGSPGSATCSGQVTGWSTTPTGWDNTVPWNYGCGYSIPGAGWGGCSYNGGNPHTNWGCQCNPYTWP